jgi:hypothetical protein
MSRSRIHTPVISNHKHKGEKDYKDVRAGKERVAERELIAHGDYDELLFEQAPWNEDDTNRDGRKYDADYYDGEFTPHRFWDSSIYGAWEARAKEYKPDLAKKRRSK